MFKAFWRQTPGNETSPPCCLAGFASLFRGAPGVINQQHDARDDGDIRKIEDIPGERTNVKVIEVGDEPIGQPVIGVPKCTANDKSKAEPRSLRSGAPQPKAKKTRGGKGQGKKGDPLGSVLGREKRIGNAGIFGIDHIEERCEPDRLACLNPISKDKPKLVCLVGGERCARRQQPQEAGPHGHCPKARNSRSAWASRGLTPGNSGSVPTSGEILQDLAHLRPCARSGRTATPKTSSSRKASAGPSPDMITISEVMQMSAKSTESRILRRLSSVIYTRVAASREEPIRFCARSISRAPVTADLTRRIFSHFAASASSRQKCGISGNSSRWIETACG